MCVCVLAGTFVTVCLCLFQTYIFTDGEDKELQMRTGKNLSSCHSKKKKKDFENIFTFVVLFCRFQPIRIIEQVLL